MKALRVVSILMLLLATGFMILPGTAWAVAPGTITTVSGNGTAGNGGDGGPATQAQHDSTRAIYVNSDGSYLVLDRDNHRIRLVDAAGVITAFAGTGVPGYGNTTAALSQFNEPRDAAKDAAGNVYVADRKNKVIRKIAADLTSDPSDNPVTRFVGIPPNQAPAGNPGDGGQATLAELVAPFSVAIDKDGNLLIADHGINPDLQTVGHRIRKVDMVTGIITTIAGTGVRGFSGDGGPATLAQLDSPYGLNTDLAGNVYFADRNNHRIRKVEYATGIITTVAGSGPAGQFLGGYGGDGGLATAARLNDPTDVIVDSQSNLLISDRLNHRIRKVDINGTITTVVGTGVAGYSGDGGSAINAQVNDPTGLGIGDFDNYFIADGNNNVVRRVEGPFQILYSDAVQAPWINSSWGNVTDFAHAVNVHNGTKSISAQLGAWGSQGFHSGPWGNPSTVPAGAYFSVKFWVLHQAATNRSIGVFLTRDAGGSFTTRTVSVPPNVWTQVEFTMANLNPNNLGFDRINITNNAGTAATFYFDNIVLGPNPVTDVIPPSVAFTTPTTPAEGTVVNSPAITASGTAADVGGAVASVKVRLNGAPNPWLTATGTASWTQNLVLVNGPNTIEAQSFDTANLPSVIVTRHVTYTPEAIKPTVAILTPAGGTNFVSPGIVVTGTAADNVGGSGLNRVNVRNNGGAWLIATGTANWTQNVNLVNGANLIQAMSVDNAGNSSDTVNVNVTLTLPASVAIYGDALAAPWIDASWSVTRNFANTDPVFAGVNSISGNFLAWGAVNVHSGPWGAGAVAVNPALYSAVKVAVFNPNATNASVGISLASDAGGGSFPIQTRTAVAGVWTVLEVPMSALNPGGVNFHRIAVTNFSSVAKTLYLDDWALVNGGPPVKALAAAAAPSEFSLGSNYPNPFNPSTKIAYEVPQQAYVTLTVYNILGEEVIRLVDGQQAPGRYVVTWNGQNRSGSIVATGVYLYRLTTSAGFVESKRMTLLK